MYHGIIVNGVDLLERDGLILLADLKIGAATPREKYIEIPGASGVLDLSESPAGAMTYEPRNISGRLFKRCDDVELETLRHALAQSYHGQRVHVTFPSAPDFYFAGRLRIGELQNYGSGIIPFSMTADPWAYASDESSVAVTAAAAQTVELTNSGQRVVPAVSTTQPVTLAWDNKITAIPVGENQTIAGFYLPPGVTSVTLTPTGAAAMVNIKWRERYL